MHIISYASFGIFLVLSLQQSLLTSVVIADHDNNYNQSLSRNYKRIPICESNSANLTNFVIGGNTTTSHKFPWIVNIRTFEKSSVTFKCGGALINWNVVLTAAHCLVENGTTQQLSPEHVAVIAGDYNISCLDGSEQISYAQEIRIHPDWNGGDNDIALIQLADKLGPTEAVQIISLSTSDLPKDSKTGIVAGWGQNKNRTNTFSDVLREAIVPILNAEECKLKDSQLQFCAGGTGSDICIGDSGGPLMCLSNNNSYICGIASRASGPTCANGPGIFMNVHEYKEWIEENREFQHNILFWIFFGIIVFGLVVVGVVVIKRKYRFKRGNHGYALLDHDRDSAVLLDDESVLFSREHEHK